MTDREPDELPSQYAPADVEARRYEHWEKAGYFTPEAQENENAPLRWLSLAEAYEATSEPNLRETLDRAGRLLAR